MNVEDFRITLTFDVETTNKLLDAIQKLPYGEVYLLLDNIRTQIDSQLVNPESFDKVAEVAPFSGEVEHPF
jgi:hypothetical protein